MDAEIFQKKLKIYHRLERVWCLTTGCLKSLHHQDLGWLQLVKLKVWPSASGSRSLDVFTLCCKSRMKQLHFSYIMTPSTSGLLSRFSVVKAVLFPHLTQTTHSYVTSPAMCHFSWFSTFSIFVAATSSSSHHPDESSWATGLFLQWVGCTSSWSFTD